MLDKYETLTRRPGERLRPFWNRFAGFYEDNRIKANDKLQTNGVTATADEPESRYGTSSDIVTFLHMAHPHLPAKVKAMFHAKLEYQDLASIKDQILDRGQAVLDDLEGSHSSVRRAFQRPQQPRQQYNRGSYGRSSYQGNRPRMGGTTQMTPTRSPPLKPK